jgi:hypothetical protein
MVEMSKREAIIEVVNRLFIYTDLQQWDKLKQEVFASDVMFDMSSAGGTPASKLTSGEICNMWEQGFRGIDAVHHQAGNYIVTLRDETNADVLCYAVATHYKQKATKGNVREFVGSYDIVLVFTDIGWRINGFRYNLKYSSGNSSLE